MLKEFKYLLFISIILAFLFFVGRYYFSDVNKKKSYRALNMTNQKISIYTKNLKVLDDDTKNIIEYTKETKSPKMKKYLFWELLDKND